MKKTKKCLSLLISAIMVVSLAACAGTVSYTHLDVYKRQVPDGAKSKYVR